MTITSDIAKVQHYVPQFVLRNFSSGSKPHVFVFDKKREVVFKTNIKNVASENGFYDFEVNGTNLTIEPSLSHLESEISHILRKTVIEESLSNVTKREKEQLSVFLAVQFARAKQTRIRMKQLNDSLEKVIIGIGGDPKKVDGWSPADEEDIKTSAIMGILSAADDYTPYFFDKAWLLFKTSKSQPHYISDNPITLQNMNDFHPFGNLGLAVRGIEIYFPISDTLSLGLYCRSHEELIRDGYKQYLAVKRIGLIDMVNVEQTTIDGLERLNYGLETGNAIESRTESVINRNSLQVMFSSRFVFSSRDNFDLVREMIETNPRYKEGLTIEAN